MKVRKAKFDFSSVPKDWETGNPFKAHFFNAFSLIIPKGEAFFMRAIGHFGRSIGDSEVGVFVAQEANHTRVHEELNRVLLKQRAMSPAFFRTEELMHAIYIRRGLFHELVATTCLEYLTYIFSRIILEGDLLKDADPEMKRFWYWHAIEEIDHKSVAYRISDKLKVSYMRRVVTMTFVLQPLFILLIYGIYLQAKLDGQTLGTTVRQGWRFLVTEDRFLLKFVAYLLPFFLPSHRPQDVSDESILRAFQELDGRDVVRNQVAIA